MAKEPSTWKKQLKPQMNTDEHRYEGVAERTDVTPEVNRFLWKNLCLSVSICGFPSFFEFQLPDLGSREGPIRPEGRFLSGTSVETNTTATLSMLGTRPSARFDSQTRIDVLFEMDARESANVQAAFTPRSVVLCHRVTKEKLPPPSPCRPGPLTRRSAGETPLLPVIPFGNSESFRPGGT